MKLKSGSRKTWRIVSVLASALVLFALDRFFKELTLQYLKPGDTVSVLSGWLELAYVQNTGVAFGLFKGQIWFVVSVTLIAFVLILILLFRYEQHTFFSYSACSLFLAGGVGNMADRLMYGFVVDYIHVMFFDYIFNFADCCITVGAVVFAIHYLFFSGKEKKALDAPEEKEQAGEES